MINIERQVHYWRQSAEEDWAVADELVGKGRIRHGLFFAHLALEKMLKAHVCRVTQDMAPRIHNLVRLSERAKIPLNEQQLDLLAEMNAFQVEGRYPDSLAMVPSESEARSYLARAKEVFEWLTRQL